MSEEMIELTRRISAAFDRMDQGLEALARKRAAEPQAAAPADGEGGSAATPALLRALEAARASSDEWAERYRSLQAQMNEQTLAMAADIARLTEELAAAKTAAPAPAQSGEDSPEMDALIARIAEQEAELESLRAERSRDAVELAEIIAALDPLVQEASHV